MEPLHRTLTIEGPAGDLEALLWAPLSSSTPPMAAVVCHPHPLFGGTMHNKVVYQSAKTLHSFGLAVLRFNFRGVGLSQGAYDRGRGEAGDVSAALDYLVAEFPRVALLAAGFSFGAWVGLRVGCADERVSELIGLGLPVNEPAFDFAYLRECGKPKLILQGAEDQFAAKEKVEALVAGFGRKTADATRVAFIPGGDHFFAGHIQEMTGALAQWFAERHPNLAVTSF